MFFPSLLGGGGGHRRLGRIPKFYRFFYFDGFPKTRCARPSLTGVGHRDLGWTLLGQGVFGKAELRHLSCANLGTCILRFANFSEMV